MRRLLMVDIEKIQAEIVQRLLPLNPQKIILFGSYADGTADEDSDIDLYVVTSDDRMPANWHEKNDIYLTVSRMIRDLRRRVPFDLIVHTGQMHEKFLRLNSTFSREINSRGVRLL